MNRSLHRLASVAALLAPIVFLIVETGGGRFP
jgi:hypothetical protein